MVLDERRQKLELGGQLKQSRRKARTLAGRLQDVPLDEVMTRLGYGGERHVGGTLYRDEHGRAIVAVENEQAKHVGRIVARNSVDLVLHVCNVRDEQCLTAHDSA